MAIEISSRGGALPRRAASASREGEIVGCRRIEDERVLDARHAAGRDGEELGDADAVFQQRDALVVAV
jgi:hypothetical protein